MYWIYPIVFFAYYIYFHNRFLAKENYQKNETILSNIDTKGEAVKIIIFDMDGTLIDSGEDITKTVNFIRDTNHHLPPLTTEEVVAIINRPKRNLAKLFYGTDTYSQTDHDLFESHYHHQCIQNPILYPHIKTTLQTLKSQGIKLSVATNAPSTFAKRMITHLGIEKYFDHIIGPDISGKSKPHPDMLEHILLRYGFAHDKHQAWMVGDNNKDMQAAQEARIQTVFATWGFSSEGEGDFVINSPLSLLKIIETNY